MSNIEKNEEEMIQNFANMEHEKLGRNRKELPLKYKPIPLKVLLEKMRISSMLGRSKNIDGKHKKAKMKKPTDTNKLGELNAN